MAELDAARHFADIGVADARPRPCATDCVLNQDGQRRTAFELLSYPDLASNA